MNQCSALCRLAQCSLGCQCLGGCSDTNNHFLLVPPLQGLFERHKLIVATQLCMAVLRSKGELQRAKFEFLLRGPKEMGVDNPLGDWVGLHMVGTHSKGRTQSLARAPCFHNSSAPQSA